MGSMTDMQRYEMHRKMHDDEVGHKTGPLGIQGWKPAKKTTIKFLYHAGKLAVQVAVAHGLKDADHAKMLQACPKEKLAARVMELLKAGIDFKKLKF